MKNEIPRWGWYNGMFLHKLDDAIRKQPNQTISEFHKSFIDAQLNGIAFPLQNQGLAISLLYMLLVVPREMWESSQQVGTQFEFNTKHLFTFRTGATDDNWQFIRLMRNAISHANFEMDKSGTYVFWNTNNAGIKNFEVSIIHISLFEFISEIGKYYINRVSIQK
jgi:hypothetical protein